MLPAAPVTVTVTGFFITRDILSYAQSESILKCAAVDASVIFFREIDEMMQKGVDEVE